MRGARHRLGAREGKRASEAEHAVVAPQDHRVSEALLRPKLDQPTRARDRIHTYHSQAHLERDDHVDPWIIEPRLGELAASDAHRINSRGSAVARDDVPPPFVPTAADAIMATA